MSYYPDLDTSSMLGHGDHLRAIGWLASDTEYTRGTISSESLDQLRKHIATAFQPMAFGGWHDCEFCNDCKGYGNLLIPTADVVYVAPEMIVHYICEHSYVPPEEFLTALANCPPQQSPEYMSLMKPFFSYFRITPPDPLPNAEQQAQLSQLLSRAFRDIVRLCHEGKFEAARVLAEACEDLPEDIHGCGLWYRDLFARGVRNDYEKNPALLEYLTTYNDIFGEDTDPGTTEYLNQLCGYEYPNRTTT